MEKNLSCYAEQFLHPNQDFQKYCKPDILPFTDNFLLKVSYSMDCSMLKVHS